MTEVYEVIRETFATIDFQHSPENLQGILDNAWHGYGNPFIALSRQGDGRQEQLNVLFFLTGNICNNCRCSFNSGRQPDTCLYRHMNPMNG